MARVDAAADNARVTYEPSPRMTFRALGIALLWSLLPLLASIVTLAIGLRDRDDVTVETFVEGMPFLIAAVALPSGLPIWVATGRRTRLGVVAAMTAVAVVAAVVNVGSDDSQAGLPFVWVATIAVPLAAVVALAQLLQSVSNRKALD